MARTEPFVGAQMPQTAPCALPWCRRKSRPVCRKGHSCRRVAGLRQNTAAGFAATVQRLGQPEQRVQPAVVCGAAFGRGKSFVDLLAAVADVVGAKQRQRFRRCAVAPARPIS